MAEIENARSLRAAQQTLFWFYCVHVVDDADEKARKMPPPDLAALGGKKARPVAHWLLLTSGRCLFFLAAGAIAPKRSNVSLEVFGAGAGRPVPVEDPWGASPDL